jgi:mono/diheme cytochrome c family protein
MTRNRALFVATAALVAPLLLNSASFAGRAAPAAKAVTVNVTARDYSFKLSKKVAPAGPVTFVVKNTGKKNHNFKITNKKTPILKPGKSAKLVVTFKKAGKFAYISTVPGDAKKGMKGAFTIKAAPAPAATNLTAGKTVFVTTGCGSCHTLKAADGRGSIGPNLDSSKIARAAVILRVTGGKGAMPSYAGQLSSKQIEDVADFVVGARTG